jgi:hypothetical protein
MNERLGSGQTDMIDRYLELLGDVIPEEIFEDHFRFDVDLGVIECSLNTKSYFYSITRAILPDFNEEVDQTQYDRWARRLSAHASAHFQRSLQAKIERTVEELYVESLFFAVSTSGMEKNLPIAREDVLKASRSGMQEIKRRLNIARGGSEPEYDLSKLNEFYEKFHPAVIEAKRTATQTRNRDRARSMIRAGFTELDNDLIELLFGFASVPDHLMDKLIASGTNGKPSHIALEQAARSCGVPPFRYTIRHLQEVKRKQQTVKSKR